MGSIFWVCVGLFLCFFFLRKKKMPNKRNSLIVFVFKSGFVFLCILIFFNF